MEAKEIHDKIDKIDPTVAQISIALNGIKEVLHDLTDEINILQSGFSEKQPIVNAVGQDVPQKNAIDALTCWMRGTRIIYRE